MQTPAIYTTKTEHRKWLSQLLRKEMQDKNLSRRQLSRNLGINTTTLLGWLNEESLPAPSSWLKLQSYFGWQATPFHQVQQGLPNGEVHLAGERALRMLAKLPRTEQLRLLDDFEGLILRAVRRHGLDQQPPPQPPDLCGVAVPTDSQV